MGFNSGFKGLTCLVTGLSINLGRSHLVRILASQPHTTLSSTSITVFYHNLRDRENLMKTGGFSLGASYSILNLIFD